MKATISAGRGLPALVSAFGATAWTGVLPSVALFALMLVGIVALVLMNAIPQGSADKRRLWEALFQHLAVRRMVRTSPPGIAADNRTASSETQR
jgi:hypothetical protein